MPEGRGRGFLGCGQVLATQARGQTSGIQVDVMQDGVEVRKFVFTALEVGVHSLYFHNDIPTETIIIQHYTFHNNTIHGGCVAHEWVSG